ARAGRASAAGRGQQGGSRRRLPGGGRRARACARALRRGGTVLPRHLGGDRPGAHRAPAGGRRQPRRHRMGTRRQLGRVRRLVVKVGTGLITAPSTGPDRRRIAALAADITAARADGARDVVLVTSGAIATGMARLALPERPRTMPEKQAAAAVGQSTLMRHYEVAFKRHGIGVGQVLLTAQDISDRARYLNARNTLRALLRFGVLPIVNENDTVAVEEIKVGDNDNLSALVASLIDADLLALPTDVDGLYTANPAVNEDAHLLETVEAVTDEITSLAWAGTGS